MNKNLLTILAIGALAACTQADAPTAEAQQATQQIAQKMVEMQVTHVDAAAALTTMRTRPDLVVIDVRTPGEFAGGHIDGAINIDFKNANFATEIAKLDGTQDYLIHCRSGGRSTASLTRFNDAGFSHIIHMDGGILGWNKAELPTVK